MKKIPLTKSGIRRTVTLSIDSKIYSDFAKACGKSKISFVTEKLYKKYISMKKNESKS